MTNQSSAQISADEVAAVQKTWAQVKTISDTAADLFYDKLFALDPSLRALFPSDLSEQKKKLMATLDFAVATLTKPDALLPAVRALGQRHVSYGVQPAHYSVVGAALLDTLETGLGAGFTDEVRGAWTKTYGVVSSTMQHAAAQG